MLSNVTIFDYVRQNGLEVPFLGWLVLGVLADLVVSGHAEYMWSAGVMFGAILMYLVKYINLYFGWGSSNQRNGRTNREGEP